MAKKEQVTITLSPELLKELKQVAKRTNSSLSQVIENYLSANSLSGRSQMDKVLELAEEIKDEIKK
jgi:predicted transcriptional regulator